MDNISTKIKNRDKYLADMNKQIINNIKTLLNDRNMSYGTLASKAGVSQGNLSVYFSDDNKNERKDKMIISLKTLLSITYALDVDISDLINDIKIEKNAEMINYYPNLAIYSYKFINNQNIEINKIPLPLLLLDNFNKTDVFIINIDDMNLFPFFKQNDKLIISTKFFNFNNQKERYYSITNLQYGFDFEKYYLLQDHNNINLYKISMNDSKKMLVETIKNNTTNNESLDVFEFYNKFKIIGKVIHIIS